MVIERTGSGNLLDTHRNEREWQFTVIIKQEIGKKTPEEAYSALLSAVDAVITSFDTDPMLLDSNSVAQAMRVKVVPVDFIYATGDQMFHSAELQVAIADVVNRWV
jgi:hypothetical protein